MSTLPQKPDYAELEKEMRRFWEESRIFEKVKERNGGGPPFSFVDGPITANNSMGVHHAWGRTLKDVFLRYKAMNGFACRYQNGFDCQGLWLEVEVEKALGYEGKRGSFLFRRWAISRTGRRGKGPTPRIGSARCASRCGSLK